MSDRTNSALNAPLLEDIVATGPGSTRGGDDDEHILGDFQDVYGDEDIEKELGDLSGFGDDDFDTGLGLLDDAADDEMAEIPVLTESVDPNDLKAETALSESIAEDAEQRSGASDATPSSVDDEIDAEGDDALAHEASVLDDADVALLPEEAAALGLADDFSNAVDDLEAEFAALEAGETSAEGSGEDAANSVAGYDDLDDVDAFDTLAGKVMEENPETPEETSAVTESNDDLDDAAILEAEIAAAELDEEPATADSSSEEAPATTADQVAQEDIESFFEAPSEAAGPTETIDELVADEQSMSVEEADVVDETTEVSSDDIESFFEDPTDIEPVTASEVADDDIPTLHESPGEAVASLRGELHAQLSEKLDRLVAETVTSLASELETQLALRVESLMVQSLEASLPKIMEHIIVGMRNEIQPRIREELPDILGEILGRHAKRNA